MKAIVLLSGGLDSGLAAKIVQNQGITLRGVTFKSYFFDVSRAAQKQADELGIPLTVIDISQEQLGLVKKPHYGYGVGMNPCIDCHGLMLKTAKELARKERVSFLITGDVLGQRPMSQNKRAMMVIDREVGVEGLVLRPLSAKLLAPTIPEKNGWVDRKKLFSIQGKSRRKQLELSKKFGLWEYTTPASGCLLTDPNFSQRLKSLLAKIKSPSSSDLALLKLGRHFWQKDVLIVVGRNEKENKEIQELSRKGDVIVELKDIPGPTTLVRSWREKIRKANTEKAKKLTKYYSVKARKERIGVIWEIRVIEERKEHLTNVEKRL